MYVNSSRTVLATIAVLGGVIGFVLFLVASGKNSEGAAQLWTTGGAFIGLGFTALLAYLVARSVSYDVWFRSPDSAEWRTASEAQAKTKNPKPVVELDRSDRIPSNE